MSIRILNRYQHCSLPIMFSRCMSSAYRSINQTLSRKKYHLLNNSITIANQKFHISKIIYEISWTFGLALFLLYLFYQLLGNFILIIFIIGGVLCKYLKEMNVYWLFVFKHRCMVYKMRCSINQMNQTILELLCKHLTHSICHMKR